MSEDNQIIGFVKWLLKWFVILIFGLSVLGLSVWGITYSYQYWTHDRYLNDIKVQVFNGSNFIIEDNGEVSGPWQKYQNKANLLSNEDSKKKCSDEMPVYISYKNSTTKVIEYIEIDFEARLPGHSSNILDWGAELESDLIVLSGKAAAYCAKLPVKEQYQIMIICLMLFTRAKLSVFAMETNSVIQFFV